MPGMKEWCCITLLIILAARSDGFVVLVQDSTTVDNEIFLAALDGPSHYKIDPRRTATHVHKIFQVNQNTGAVKVKKKLRCDGTFYPNPVTMWIEAWSDNENAPVDYASLPLRIIILGPACTFSRGLEKEISSWKDTVALSLPLPDPDPSDRSRLCLKSSQVILRLSDLIPKSLSGCNVTYSDLSDEKFKVESSGNDLVSVGSHCLYGVSRLRVNAKIMCEKHSVSYTNELLLVLQSALEAHEASHIRRIRRQMQTASPYFERTLEVAQLPEEVETGTSVITLSARDPESAPLIYSIEALLDSRSQRVFQINPGSGLVTTKSRVDREQMDVHYFRVKAIDNNSSPARSATTTLQINIEDSNDHRPVFEHEKYTANVRESISVGAVVLTIRATDEDAGSNSNIRYAIIKPSGPNQVFRLNPLTGELTTRLPLDRETSAQYELIVQAEDQASPKERKSSKARVYISVQDENDNYPQFTERTYTVEVPEDINAAGSPVIAHIQARDSDDGKSGQVRYAIIGGNNAGHFTIDGLSGEVRVSSPLDHENIDHYRLVIRAQDVGSPPRSNTTRLLVNIRDVNDNAPRFYTPLFQENIQENIEIGYSIVRVQAYDNDARNNSFLTYKIDSKGVSLPLGIDETTGWITTKRILDREEGHHYSFSVIATDHGSPSKSATASVVLQVQDVNDNDPVFYPKNYEVSVSESDPPGTPVVSVIATDKDENQRIHYEITSGDERGRFSMTVQNGKGIITIAQPLDYKKERRYVLTLIATDSGERQDTATVYINVTDANTFPPVFENTPYSATIFEDAPVGSTVVVVAASDGDTGENARITYSLSGDTVEEFTIHPSTGAVTTTKPLDREIQGGYLLTVTARDNGVPSKSDTTDVEITVVDVNDNSPVFEQPSYKTTISEGDGSGTSVLQVRASDADAGLNGRLKYTFEGGDDGGGSFTIDSTSGVIRTARPLDRESVAKYSLVVIAKDKGAPERSTSILITVELEDINDNPPSFDTDRLQLYISENSPIGSTVGEIKAHDPDEGKNAVIQYSIIGGPDAESFSLVPHPAEGRAELVTRIELDYESTKKKYQLFVRATSDPLQFDISVTIHVVDVNDNAPALEDFRIIFNNYKNHFPTGSIGKVPAIDRDVTDQLSFRIISGNKAGLVEIGLTSGEISMSPSLNTNVPITATMGISVSDGLNEVSAEMKLQVRLVTESMLYNSVTVRLADMTQEAFLSPLLDYFIDGLAAIIPCPTENIYIFNILDDTDVENRILNISFSAKRADVAGDVFYTPDFLRERVYLNRATLAALATVQVLPFDDNLCVREPCLNFETCVSVLKFGNASSFISSRSILFRPIYTLNTFACVCPKGFTGMREQYDCDTELDLCYSSPCLNHGTCVRREGGYTCLCLPEYTGQNCEVNMLSDHCIEGVCAHGSTCTDLVSSSKIPHLIEGVGYVGGGGFTCTNCTRSHFHKSTCELTARRFSQGTYLTFPAMKSRHRLHIQMSFSTREPNGLLLYNGRYNERHDFIALQIVDETVVFSFSLGSRPTHVSAAVSGGVSDGRWHTVTVNYFNRRATISLDDCDTELSVKFGRKVGHYYCANSTTHRLEDRCSNLIEVCYRFLDLAGPLQIGGLPSLPTTYQVSNQHYQGCIKDLYMDHAFVDMNSYVANNGTQEGCHDKNFFCRSHPCQNGGSCTETYGTYLCKCPEGWSGKECTQGVDFVKELRGTGILIMTSQHESIKYPWHTSISFRTLHKYGLLMSVTIGSSASVIELYEGYIQYRYENLTIRLTNSQRIDDGEWHNIKVKWMEREVWLNLDYGDYELTNRVLDDLKGQYVGSISVGGVANSKARKVSRFKGCVKDVRVGNKPNSVLQISHERGAKDGCSSPNPCSARPCPQNSKCRAKWSAFECTCNSGFYGKYCDNVCNLNPCNNNATCLHDVHAKRGYRCQCVSEEYAGEYCEIYLHMQCPTSWWGKSVCGPCDCDVEKGYSGDCDKNTGECRCKTHHYQPTNSETCFPCDCYMIGSNGPECDAVSGQCSCRKGVIGRRCDRCANPSSEVTPVGCQNVYDGCPKNFVEKVWWEQTKYGASTVQNCPTNAEGQGTRKCLKELGWEDPDMFDCVSKTFIDLRDMLGQLESGTLEITTYVAVKLSEDLNEACSLTQPMWGSDVLIASRLIILLLEYETHQQGLNLTHRQDKNYIQNIIESASIIVQLQYEPHWFRINGLRGFGADSLLSKMDEYVATLAISQGDTYTRPFEIPTSNIIFGLDTVSSRELYGFTSTGYAPGHSTELGQVTIPGNLNLIDSSYSENTGKVGASVIIPKYNNYLKNQQTWAKETRIRIPLNLLDIPHFNQDEIISNADDLGTSQGVVSYVIFKTLGDLLPESYSGNVARRWGVGLAARSPVFTLAVHTSEKGLIHGRLNTGVQLRFKMDKKVTVKSNPQCVTWDLDEKGDGFWSREGCKTGLPETVLNASYVNCSCDHLSSFAVILNDVQAELLTKPSTAENVTSYIGLIISLGLLLCSFIAFCVLRGASTNSNNIHKNITFCLFLAQFLFLVALKKRQFLIDQEFPCKIIAICLHYFWLTVFTWLMIEGIHLYRMLTEMRDVNHGSMRFYYSCGYGLPAIVVGLSVGVRIDQYGNVLFCWLSIYESVAWALVGPICFIVSVILMIFVFAIRASLTLKGHIEGFGNLRTLLWLGIMFLPLLGATWVLAIMSVSQNQEVISFAFSFFSFLTSVFVFVGYCLLNSRVRDSLYFVYLKCMGRKVPYHESVSSNKPTNSRSTLTYNDDFNILRRNIGISTASTTSRSTCKTSSSPYSREGISEGGCHHSSSTQSNYNSNTDLNSQSIRSPYAYNDSTNFHRKKSKVESKGRGGKDSDSGSEISGVDGRSMELASSHSSDDDTTTHNGTLRVHDVRMNPPPPPAPTGCPPVPPKPLYQPNNDLDSGGSGGLEVRAEPLYSKRITSIDSALSAQCGPSPGSRQAVNDSIGLERPNRDSPMNIRPPIYATHWSSQLPPADPGLYKERNVAPSYFERLSSTTASDNELEEPELRVQSRPTLSAPRYTQDALNNSRYSQDAINTSRYSEDTLNTSRFSDNTPVQMPRYESRYSPAEAYNTYSPSSRVRNLESRIYGADNRRYSPNTRYSPAQLQDTGYPGTEHIYNRGAPRDEAGRLGPAGHEIYSTRPESRTSLDSDRRKYIATENPYNRYKIPGTDVILPQSQDRYLHNLKEDPSPIEKQGPIITSLSPKQFSPMKEKENNLNMTSPSSNLTPTEIVYSPTKPMQRIITPSSNNPISDSEYV